MKKRLSLMNQHQVERQPRKKMHELRAGSVSVGTCTSNCGCGCVGPSGTKDNYNANAEDGLSSGSGWDME